MFANALEVLSDGVQLSGSALDFKPGAEQHVAQPQLCKPTATKRLSTGFTSAKPAPEHPPATCLESSPADADPAPEAFHHDDRDGAWTPAVETQRTIAAPLRDGDELSTNTCQVRTDDLHTTAIIKQPANTTQLPVQYQMLVTRPVVKQDILYRLPKEELIRQLLASRAHNAQVLAVNGQLSQDLTRRCHVDAGLRDQNARLQHANAGFHDELTRRDHTAAENAREIARLSKKNANLTRNQRRTWYQKSTNSAIAKWKTAERERDDNYARFHVFRQRFEAEEVQRVTVESKYDSECHAHRRTKEDFEMKLVQIQYRLFFKRRMNGDLSRHIALFVMPKHKLVPLTSYM